MFLARHKSELLACESFVRACARGSIEEGGHYRAQYTHDHSFRVGSGRNGLQNLPRIVESRRALCTEPSLLLVEPRSELPPCESCVRMCHAWE